jgi:hypothetical protein
MIIRKEISSIYTGKGLVRKWSEPRGRRDRVWAVKVHSRLYRETALLRATGGRFLWGISSEVVGRLSLFLYYIHNTAKVFSSSKFVLPSHVS